MIAHPLLLFALGNLLRKLLLEALDAAGGIDQLLLAGEERMAIRADFQSERVRLGGRTGFEFIAAACTVDRYGVVFRVNIFLHNFLFWRGRMLPYA